MIRFGIIGAGNIAYRFADSLEAHPDGELRSISCRNPEKGAAFAGRYNVERVYTDYEAILGDEDIDAVYVALPHGMHMEWSKKAMESGKAVLCEKPAAISAAEVKQIAEVSRRENVLFMEAMKPRFVPVYSKLRQLLGDGAIGELKSVEASLCRDFHFNQENASYHTDPKQGGCLLDMGIYGVSYLEDFLEGEPVIDKCESVDRFGVEFYVNASLIFEGSKTGALEVAFDRDKPETVRLTGTAGQITVEKPSRPQKLILEAEGQKTVITEEYKVDDFYGEIDHFIRCLDSDSPESELMPLDSSIRCAGIIDGLKNMK